MLASDQWTHLAGGIVSRTNLQDLQTFRNCVNKWCGNIAHRHNDRDSHAPLSSGTVRCGDGCVSCEINVCVWQDHHVVLGAAKCLCSLATRCGSRVDRASNGSRADETDSIDARVLKECSYDVSVAMEDVKDAVGESCVFEVLSEQEGGGRVLL